MGFNYGLQHEVAIEDIIILERFAPMKGKISHLVGYQKET